MVHYLDHAATTAVRPEAIEAMLSVMRHHFGNPSGAHRMARYANRLLDDARDTMAELLGAEPGQIVFTSGGTEADNLAIMGGADASGGRPVCSAVEHHAVLDPTTHLNGQVIAVNPDGQIDLDHLACTLSQMGDEVGVVSVMTANNETGIIQPLDSVVEVVRQATPQAMIHTDAVQAFNWLDLADFASGVDLISVSAHKFGGPKGVGALVVRDRAKLNPRALGGGQERDRRGGTQNVPGIVAMAAAARAAASERATQVSRVGALRDRMRTQIMAAVPDTFESGCDPSVARTANVCHLCFERIESEALLFLLEKAEIMASAASSCASGAMDPSHVLAAMGVSRSLAAGSVRLSLGYTSTDADVDAVVETLPAAVERLRARS